MYGVSRCDVEPLHGRKGAEANARCARVGGLKDESRMQMWTLSDLSEVSTEFADPGQLLGIGSTRCKLPLDRDLGKSLRELDMALRLKPPRVGVTGTRTRLVTLSRIVLDLIFEPGQFRLVPRAYREGEGDVRTCESSLVRVRGLFESDLFSWPSLLY